MADDKEKTSGYSVDEILAEYGSERPQKNPKVVDFPDLRVTPPPEPGKPQPVVSPARRRSSPAAGKQSPGPEEAAGDRPQAAGAGQENAGAAPREERPAAKAAPAAQKEGSMPKIVPQGVGRAIGARLSALKRQAEHFADHMYDEAEPSEEEKKAEKYLPGVDQEEDAGEEDRSHRAKSRPPKRQEELPPDIPPAQLVLQYRKGLVGQGRRVIGAMAVAILTLVLSLCLPLFHWDLPAGGALSPFQLQSLVLTILLAVAGGLCYEIPTSAVQQATEMKMGAETVVSLAWILTLLDGFTAGRLEERSGCLPCSAITAFALAFSLWGIHARRSADRASAKSAAMVHTPYVVTLDEDKWNAKPAFSKRSDVPLGLGSQIQAEDGPQRIYRIAAPLLILGGLLGAMLASIGRGIPGRFIWSASVCLTAASSWSALLAYGLPYRSLTDRLNKVGAALAGWPGVLRCGPAGIIMTDNDLFPTGSVTVTQVNVFGGAATEKVVAYTATLMRVLDCGLTRPFHDLLRAQGAIYREVSGVVKHQGGVSGVIRNQEVLVGTADFMHMMNIAMPAGHSLRAAIFCAIDGQLCGLFPLRYSLNPAVAPSLNALIREGVSPVLATRDPVLIPAMLKQKFHLPVDNLEFPSVERRLELSDRDQDHDPTTVAILSRQGLIAYCDAVLGGRRLKRAAQLGLICALAGAVLGLIITFYLTSAGAFASLTTLNFFVFMAAWLVPELVVSNWVNQF